MSRTPPAAHLSKWMSPYYTQLGCNMFESYETDTVRMYEYSLHHMSKWIHTRIDSDWLQLGVNEKKVTVSIGIREFSSIERFTNRIQKLNRSHPMVLVSCRRRPWKRVSFHINIVSNGVFGVWRLKIIDKKKVKQKKGNYFWCFVCANKWIVVLFIRRHFVCVRFFVEPNSFSFMQSVK